MAISFTQVKARSKIRRERRDHLHQLELPLNAPPDGPVKVWYWKFGKMITLP